MDRTQHRGIYPCVYLLPVTMLCCHLADLPPSIDHAEGSLGKRRAVHVVHFRPGGVIRPGRQPVVGLSSWARPRRRTQQSSSVGFTSLGITPMAAAWLDTPGMYLTNLEPLAHAVRAPGDAGDLGPLIIAVVRRRQVPVASRTHPTAPLGHDSPPQGRPLVYLTGTAYT